MYGTSEEAKAMLEKAVAAVKQDKTKALDMFNKGEGGFKDRDLYVFCANASDGIMTAQLREIFGKKGYPFGQEIMEKATEGEIKEVSYWWFGHSRRFRPECYRHLGSYSACSSVSWPSRSGMTSIRPSLRSPQKPAHSEPLLSLVRPSPQSRGRNFALSGRGFQATWQRHRAMVADHP